MCPWTSKTLFTETGLDLAFRLGFVDPCCRSLMSILTYYTLDFFLKNYLFIYVWLCWVFVTLHGLFSSRCKQGLPSSCGARASHCGGFSLQSTGSRHPDSAVVVHRLSCSKACGIFPDQGSNPSPLHWQADSQPLDHQGSPIPWIIKGISHPCHVYQLDSRSGREERAA